MDYLAAQTVQTAINWPGLAISLGSFVASMAVIFAYLDRRAERRQTRAIAEQAALRAEFTAALANLGQILGERLETKENVNQLRIEVARMGEHLRVSTQLGAAGAAAPPALCEWRHT